MHRAWRGAGFAALLLALAAPAGGAAWAQSPELAIGGYDPVAYFLEDGPRQGQAGLTAEWNGARWRFASEANKTRFLAEPQRYAPQYNGWCAYAAANGYAAEVDPVNGWTIRKGKLYLNWNGWVKRLWGLRADSYIERADAQWPGLKEKIAEGGVEISRK